MAEYDLICDVCGKPCPAADAFVSWTDDGRSERGFVLTHAACVPAAATRREEVRKLVWPNEYLRFANERFGKVIAEPESLRAIVSALAPFVMRPDNAAEMDGMRAASFGAIPGVKPGTQPLVTTAPKKEVEGGK